MKQNHLRRVAAALALMLVLSGGAARVASAEEYPPDSAAPSALEQGLPQPALAEGEEYMDLGAPELPETGGENPELPEMISFFGLSHFVGTTFREQLEGAELTMYDAMQNGLTYALAKEGGCVSVELTAELEGLSREELQDSTLQASMRSWWGTALDALAADQPGLLEWLAFSNTDHLHGGTRLGVATHLDAEGLVDRATFYVYPDCTSFYSPELAAQRDAKVAQAAVCTGSRSQKVRALHDWICQNVTYDGAAASATLKTEDGFYAHSSFGLLLRGKGVCESYAKSFKMLCDAAGIPCILVTGSNHMWNYVQMTDGGWYMVDCTFDDTDTGFKTSWLLAYPNLYGHTATGRYETGSYTFALPELAAAYTQPMPGDLTGDGMVNVLDLLSLAQWAGGADCTGDWAAGDVDASGAVDAADLSLLARYLAGRDVTLS